MPLAIVFFLRTISHIQRPAFPDTLSFAGWSLMVGLSMSPVWTDGIALASYNESPRHLPFRESNALRWSRYLGSRACCKWAWVSQAFDNLASQNYAPRGSLPEVPKLA